MTDVLLETFDVARSFKRGDEIIQALAPATCHVRAGDRIAITGASGSGKSTLLHLMAHLDEPTAGEIRWPALGDPERLRPRNVAVVFQTPSLMPSLSVVENVQLPLVLAGSGRGTRAAAMEALARVGLADLAAKVPEELSGGQAQRVVVARAMAARPRLLLADEPTGQLDQATGQALMDCILDWLSGSLTALVVATHDPDIARRLNKTWWMDHGRLSFLPWE